MYKKLYPYRKAILLVFILAAIILFAVKFNSIKIVDKTTSLLRSSTEQYRTRTISQINQIVVHHAASINQKAKDYARYHVISKGWPGIGYHYVIEKDGTIVWCNLLTTVSWNVSGHNTRSIGICLSGNFTIEQPTNAQLKSLKKLIKHLRKQLPQHLPVAGHRDYGKTSCPGAHLYKHLSQFNAA